MNIKNVQRNRSRKHSRGVRNRLPRKGKNTLDVRKKRVISIKFPECCTQIKLLPMKQETMNNTVSGGQSRRCSFSHIYGKTT